MRVAVAPAALAALAFAILLSLAVGARAIPLGDVVEALAGQLDTRDAAVVTEVRLPRTVLGLVAGAALGVVRGPDPGHPQPARRSRYARRQRRREVAIMFAIWAFELTRRVRSTCGSRSLGAAVATMLVYVMGSMAAAAPRRFISRSPVRCRLSAVARASVRSRCSIPICARSASGRWALSADVAACVGRPLFPLIVVGLVSPGAVPSARTRSRSATRLARSLGTRVGRTPDRTSVAVTLLGGGGPWPAGPIAFVGLMVPHDGPRVE